MGDVFLFLKVVSWIYDTNRRFLEGGSSQAEFCRGSEIIRFQCGLIVREKVSK